MVLPDAVLRHRVGLAVLLDRILDGRLRVRVLGEPGAYEVQGVVSVERQHGQDFIRFLNAIEREVPAGKVIHAILDNYGSHKHPKVRAWLTRHPRWTFRFTPTSGSWLNPSRPSFRRSPEGA